MLLVSIYINFVGKECYISLVYITNGMKCIHCINKAVLVYCSNNISSCLDDWSRLNPYTSIYYLARVYTDQSEKYQ